jgi:hypothetical protein
MKYLITTLIVLVSVQAAGQDFSRSVGIRGGINSGVTYRQFLNPELAYEGLLSFRQRGLQFTILREHFRPAMWQVSDGFFFGYGYGGHLGFTNSHTYTFLNRHFHYARRKFSPLIGIDGYLGIEYQFPGIPVQVGLDYKPFLEMSLHQFFRMSAWDVAFSLKYTF